MGKYFGTDGIRAIAGQFPLVDDFITKLGYVALSELKIAAQAAHLKPQVIIAQDSRASGPRILEALQKGICASGVDVISLGISTTPSVAYLVKKTGSFCGVVISASHNPAEFNGIKFQCVDKGFKHNEPVDVVIRPEDIDVVAPEKGMLQGTVTSVTFKGVHYFFPFIVASFLPLLIFLQ